MNSVQPRAGMPTGPQSSSTYSSNPSSPPTTAKPATNPSSFHSMSPGLMSSTATTPSAFPSGNQAEAKSQYGSKGPSSVDGQASLADNQTPYPSVLIRRLPANMSREALTSMLLFAEDFVDAQFTALSIPEDKGFQSALARFRSSEGAQEVRQRLNGKSNAATTGMPMIVDVLQTGIDQGSDGNRKLSDPSQARKLSASASSAGSGGSVNGRSSRYNSTFRSLERVSPPNLTHGTSGSGDFSEATGSNPAMFSPQSPAAKTFFDRSRVSGKSVIADDLVDEETGELLKDPVAYAKGSQPHGQGNPISRFANLSLNTATANALGQHGQLPSARGIAGLHSPTSEFSPTSINAALNPTSPNSNYPMSPSSFEGRHHYPPANPADQNPPCNTLYVGNLPIDTSEDELKAIFSKQRGYKRLCFRTKHNGPMCFVEFEDISFATKALNELYGYPLHNSVKGGIRLSFSKNPLGVRAGQANGLGGPQSPMSPNGMSAISGFNGGPAFSTVSGPPPGLGMPPQQTTMMSPSMSNGSMSAGPTTTTFFGSGSSPPMQQGYPAGHRTSGGPVGYPGAMSPLGSHFSDHPLGRS